MGTTIELMIWRASLAVAPAMPQAADLDEWADGLGRAGEAAGAALLRDAATLLRGVAEPGAPDAARGAWTIDRLLGELDELARGFEVGDTPPPPPAVSGRPDEAGGIGPATPRVAPPADLAAAAARLVAFFATPDFAEDAGARAVADIEALCAAHARLPTFDYRAHRDAPLCDLAMAIALAALTGFALAVRELARPPLGSAAFLHRAGRLSNEGLGAWLSGVARTVRDSADVLHLAHRAAAASGGRGAVDGWIALLARGCEGPLLDALVDHLGDANRVAALGLLLGRASAMSGVAGTRLIERIRDAALDNAAWSLGARAQAVLVRRHPDANHEHAILGAIQATGGDYGAAEATYREILRRWPADAGAAERLFAVRRNRFDGFAIVGGYLSAPARQETRFRRRGLIPDHMPRRGSRIEAVDVR